MPDKNTPDSTSLVEKATAAFLQASENVVQRARQTGTSVVVWEDGEKKELTADEAAERLSNHRSSNP